MRRTRRESAPILGHIQCFSNKWCSPTSQVRTSCFSFRPDTTPRIACGALSPLKRPLLKRRQLKHTTPRLMLGGRRLPLRILRSRRRPHSRKPPNPAVDGAATLGVVVRVCRPPPPRRAHTLGASTRGLWAGLLATWPFSTTPRTLPVFLVRGLSKGFLEFCRFCCASSAGRISERSRNSGLSTSVWFSTRNVREVVRPLRRGVTNYGSSQKLHVFGKPGTSGSLRFRVDLHCSKTRVVFVPNRVVYYPPAPSGPWTVEQLHASEHKLPVFGRSRTFVIFPKCFPRQPVRQQKRPTSKAPAEPRRKNNTGNICGLWLTSAHFGNTRPTFGGHRRNWVQTEPHVDRTSINEI